MKFGQVGVGAAAVEAVQQYGDAFAVRARCPRLVEPAHGRWYFAVQVVGVDGRQVRLRRGGFDCRTDAERVLAVVVGLPAADAVARVWTVRRWLEVWLGGLEKRLRPSTVQAYRSVVVHQLIPHLGAERLAQLRVKTVQRAVDLIARQHVGVGRLIRPGTVRRIVAVLRAALSEACRQGLLDRNPAWRLRLPSGRRPHAVVWNAEREELWRQTGVRPAVAVWDVPHLVRFLDGVNRCWPAGHAAARRPDSGLGTVTVPGPPPCHW